jgi:hypothetical protein
MGAESEAKPKYDPAKKYRYTWPGCEPRVVDGAEMSRVASYSMVEMLNVEEYYEVRHTYVPTVIEKP